MVYVVQKLPKMYHNMTLDEFLFSNGEFNSSVKNYKETSTRTDIVNERNLKPANVDYLIRVLVDFNNRWAYLKDVDRKELYHHFVIPKKNGKYRPIDAPNDDLKLALRNLKYIFESEFGALYHTNAYAYIPGRSTLDAVKRHQFNESNWFAKYDLSNFFGSTTIEYIVKMLSMIYPFSEVVKIPAGKQNLESALDLCVLNGVLPQGTPISPMLTNLIMIPVDYKLSRALQDFNKQHFVYTRYADDFIISSVYDFSFREIERLIVDTLKQFDAPFSVNKQKTRYGSRAGQNFNLGIMLNKDNQITIGRKKKKEFENLLHAFATDQKNGSPWPIEDVRSLDGQKNYYKMIEGETIDKIIAFMSERTGYDIIGGIKAALKS